MSNRSRKKLVRKTNMAKMFLFGINTKVFKKKNSIYLKEFMQENQLLLFFCFLSSLYIYIILCTTALFFGYFFNKKKNLWYIKNVDSNFYLLHNIEFSHYTIKIPFLKRNLGVALLRQYFQDNSAFATF